TSGSIPTAVPAAGTATIDVHAPPVEGLVQWAGIAMEIDHPRPNDLSVEVSLPDRPGSPSQLLWDPGFHARGAAILEPASGAAVQGTVDVGGKAWQPNPLVHFHVDDVGPSASAWTRSPSKSDTRSPSRSSTRRPTSCRGRMRSGCEPSIGPETKRSATWTSVWGSPSRACRCRARPCATYGARRRPGICHLGQH